MFLYTYYIRRDMRRHLDICETKNISLKFHLIDILIQHDNLVQHQLNVSDFFYSRGLEDPFFLCILIFLDSLFIWTDFFHFGSDVRDVHLLEVAQVVAVVASSC